MKKIVNYITITVIMITVIMIIMLVNTNVYASTPIIKSDMKQSNIDNNKLQMEVSITDLENIGEGINAYSGILNFNPEELELIEVKSEEEWNTPTYNENTLKEGCSKIVATSNKFTNKKGILFVVIFEKKVEKQNYNIEFTDFEVAAKINGNTIKVTEESNENIEEISNTKDEIKTREINTKSKMGFILGILVASILLMIGILSIGFGLYRRKKGEK